MNEIHSRGRSRKVRVAARDLQAGDRVTFQGQKTYTLLEVRGGFDARISEQPYIVLKVTRSINPEGAASYLVVLGSDDNVQAELHA